MTIQYGNGFPQPNQFGQGDNMTNTSGRGAEFPAPPEVAGQFNWGAFLLSWIWGIFNKTYIALVALVIGFIPFVGGLASLAFCIYLGIKGNELAWQNKQFPSVQAFHEYQKKWAIGGLIFFVAIVLLSIIGGILAIVAGSLSGSTGN